MALCMERTAEMVVSLLGIFKTGATYLPLDPGDSPHRSAYILQDAQVALVVTQAQLVERLAAHDIPLICVDAVSSPLAQSLAPPIPCPVIVGDAAYIIYTSGSSGHPKGVRVSYGAILEHCQDVIAAYQLTSQDRVLQFAPLNFDASLEQILPPLMVGARLVVRDETIWTPREFYRNVQAHTLTVINIPPAYWHQIVANWPADFGAAALAQLRLLIVGGDVMRSETVSLWQQLPLSTVRLLNTYGPTETTITATLFEVPLAFDTSRRVPMGRPLGKRRAYVLDSYLQPVPVGVPGKLYLGGSGIALGYLNRPELTAQHFIANPFVAGERLYKTGDLVRYGGDHTLEFLGRVDSQVKLRGFRIELGEIEAVLRQPPHVRETVVIMREDTPGDPHLVGYVVPQARTSLNPHELTRFLKAWLPAYMLPTAFVILDAIPMFANGIKVDRRALPIPTYQSAALEPTFAPPTTPLEKALVDIWMQVLNVSQIGIRDDFFELGGDSLKAGQVASRLWLACEIELPLRKLFDYTTIVELARQIAADQASDLPAPRTDAPEALPIPPLVPRDRNAAIPLSFAQERIWFLNQLAPASSAYNIAQAVRLEGALNYEALTYTLKEIVRRHAALRANFISVDGKPAQHVKPTLDVVLRVVDLRTLSDPARLERVQQLGNDVAQQPFDLRQQALMRVCLIQLEDKVHVFVLSLHHIIADAHSLGLLVIEVSQLYNRYVAGVTHPLPALPIQ